MSISNVVLNFIFARDFVKITRDQDTKLRLLVAARRVFAEHGLKNATVRDICELAGANVAAVSYHFGGKEELYVAVLQAYMQDMQNLYPRDEGVTAQSGPEERLRAYIRSFLLQTLGDGDPVNDGLGRLLTREFIEPSRHFGELFDRQCRPTHEYLLGIVRQCLPGADETTVSRAASSIIGQCVLFDFAGEAIVRMNPELALGAGNIEALTDFIMEFSLGGLERLRMKQRQAA